MERKDLSIIGACLVFHHHFCDARGRFARLFSCEEMIEAGLEPGVAQVNYSHSPAAFTLRGLHWQDPPFAEAKLLTCLSGAVFDVIADLRLGSATRGKWVGQELVAGDGRQIYCPAGCAHGFLTLKPDTVVAYTTSAPYAPKSQHILRWNDPSFAINWPSMPQVISEMDRNSADLRLFD